MKNLIFILMLMSFGISKADQTVGIFYNTPSSYDGFTLFAPINNSTTYLINNCGEKIHSWPSKYKPGASVYLLENGILLRTGNVNNPTFITGGGAGGIIEMIDWDGNVIWDFTLSDSLQCLHHDIEYLKNGNILAIVWDSYTKEQALAAGRIQTPDLLWSEKVIEIKPDLVNGGGEIVWEWKVWDHLVQDLNPNADNFGNIESPQLIDLNNLMKNPLRSDWLHFNSIDYNPKLDQIMLSNHTFSELWVIDHSTTTAEAKTHTGGITGMGGDLIYRWGNQNSYSKEKIHQQMLFSQHDTHWIPDSLNDGGKVMIFNNRIISQDEGNYSAINIIELPLQKNNTYRLETSGFYGPDDYYWTYTDTPQSNFNAAAQSGAQRLPNGNTLICNGFAGIFFEVDSNSNTVWKYIPPVGANNEIAVQGLFPVGNQVFRIERFSSNYSGLKGRDLTSQGYIETGSEFTCQLFDGTTNSVGYVDNTDIEVKLIDRTLNIDSKTIIENVEIYNLSGNKISSFISNNTHYSISTNGYVSGVYLVRLTSENQKTVVFKFLVD